MQESTSGAGQGAAGRISDGGPASESASAAAEAEMTPGQLSEARDYHQRKLVLSLVDMALGLVVLAVLAVWCAQPIDAWLSTWLPGPVLRLLAMYGVIFLAHLVPSFPLDWYSDYRLEHRFKLSTQRWPSWLGRYAARQTLMGLFMAALLLGLYEIIWHCGAWWWVVAAGAFFLVSIVFGQVTTVVILPLFYKVEPLDEPQLTERLRQLAAGTGLSLSGVYRLGLSVETSKGNAMLAGLGRRRRVLLGDTLLDQFTPEEIEVIFAHELGHHVFHHIPKIIAEAFLISAVAFWLCDWAMLAWVHHLAPQVGRADLPVWALPMILLVVTLFSVLLGPLTNAISRRRERQCDRYALVHTGLRAAYRSAFLKLARLNKADPQPPRLEVLLLHSHPPIAERLAMADTGN